MPQLENFQAWISVDNSPLQEYGFEQSEDGYRVTCWVVSEEGKAFTIAWRDTVRSQASMGRTFVDGIKCGVPKGINQKGYKKDPSKENDTASQKGAPSSAGSDRLFVFAKVELTDDDSYLAVDGSEGLGEIKLEISYIQKKGGTQLAIDSPLGGGKIHETRKQLAPHRTKLGIEVQGERKPVLTVKSKGRPKVFVFKYRPKEVLKAMGIIPRDRSLVGPFQNEHIDLTEELDDTEMSCPDGEPPQAQTPDDIDMVDDAQVMSQLMNAEDANTALDIENILDKNLMQTSSSRQTDLDHQVLVPKQESTIKLEFQESRTQVKREDSCMDGISLNHVSFEAAISKDELSVKEEDTKPKIEVKTEIEAEQSGSVFQDAKIGLKKATSMKEESFKSENMVLDLTTTE